MNSDYQKLDDVTKGLICKPMSEFNLGRFTEVTLEAACERLFRHVLEIVNELSVEERYKHRYLDKANVLSGFIWGGLRDENRNAVINYLSNENFLREPFHDE